MVKVTCIETDCPNKDIEYNILGTPELVECGGCKTHLTIEPSDLPEPVTPEPTFPE